MKIMSDNEILVFFTVLKKKKVKSLQTSEVNLFPDNLNYSVGFHLFAELP